MEDLGSLYYFAPDNLEWEPLHISYSDFVYWAFTGDLDEFYGEQRWSGWEQEIKAVSGDESVSFYPFLWAEHKDFNDRMREVVNVEQLWISQHVDRGDRRDETEAGW